MEELIKKYRSMGDKSDKLFEMVINSIREDLSEDVDLLIDDLLNNYIPTQFKGVWTKFVKCAKP